MQREDQPELSHPLNPVERQVQLLYQEAVTWIGRDLPRCLSLLEKGIALAGPCEGASPSAPLGLAHCLLHYGRCQVRLGRYQLALSSYHKARTLFSSLEQKEQLAVCTGYMGVVYFYLGDHPTAFECMFAALDGARQADNPAFVAEVQNDIGFAHIHLKQYASALPYLLDSVATLRKLNDQVRLGWVLDSLCNAYHSLGEFERALQCGLESVGLAEELEEWQSLAEYLHSLGRVYQSLADDNQALECFRKSLNLAQKHGYRQDIGNSLHAIGDLLLRQGRLDLALVSLQDALVTAEQIGLKSLQMDACRSLVAVYKQLEDYQNALLYSEQLQGLCEARFDEEADRRIKNLEVLHQLENARKEAEIFQLKNIALQLEIDERKRVQARLQELADTDSLTGITNRRCFFQLALAALEQAQCQHLTLAIIMFDIDHFKVINDTYGHIAGDEVLVEIARRARNDVRPGETLARFGGEEFVVLLPETNQQLALMAAERLRKRIAAAPIRVAGAALSVTISLGVAHFHGQDDMTLEKMLDCADRALYQAKESGRNRVAGYPA